MKTTLAIAGLALFATHTPAQCTNPWVSFGPACGVSGPISASVAWDPDGPGPLPERLVVGGDFQFAGTVLANNIAAWDPATGAWSSLGSGCNASVLALAVLPNGDLVAGGRFTDAGGVPASRIARWDGVAWSPLGSGTGSGTSTYPVTALTVLPNGDLIAGGYFPVMGGVVVNGVGQWNGSSWSALGGGLPGSGVLALAVMPNGDLVAGGSGSFGSSGPMGSSLLARWNGSTWSSLGTSFAGGSLIVYALAALANGDLIVGGSFAVAGSLAANNIARWNGTTWSSLGSGTSTAAGSAAVYTLQVLPNGDVIAGGRFESAGGTAAARIARWNGTTWAPLATGMRGSTYLSPSPWSSPSPYSIPEVRTLATLANGALVAGGVFSVAGTAAAQHVARWDGVQWAALSTGPGVDRVADFAFLPGGDVVAVGGFVAAGTLVTNAVARWNGTTWSTLGSAGTGEGGVGFAVALLPNGDLVVGGAFSSIGGVAATNIARWNGTTWSAMGALPGSGVYELIVSPNGTLFAAGSFYPASAAGVFAWNGSTWNAVGGGVNGDAYALALLPDGRLVAGGWFGTANIGVWDGIAWTTLGSGLQEVALALAVLPNGDVVAAGSFGGPHGGHLWRWDGALWSQLGGFNTDVDVLHVLPNGDLIAGGAFGSFAGTPTSGIARGNGAAWSAVGSGVGVFGRVTALANAPTGEVWVGGSFSTAGGAVSGGIARLTTTCPATSQAQGAGCAGNTVTSSLPWTGSTWRADASGLPGSAAVFVVNGLATTSLPLAAVFSTALPGCTLHVQPDVVELVLANQGTATFQFAIPNTPALAGTVFHHQMVPLALDATLAVTATNALTLTVGSF